MAISTIDLLLGEWGRWARRQKDGANGFKPAWWVKLMDTEPEYQESHTPSAVDFDVLYVDKAIQKLEPKQAKLVTLYYRDSFIAADVAKEIGVSRATVFNELGRIHARIAYLLDGGAA